MAGGDGNKRITNKFGYMKIVFEGILQLDREFGKNL